MKNKNIDEVCSENAPGIDQSSSNSIMSTLYIFLDEIEKKMEELLSSENIENTLDLGIEKPEQEDKNLNCETFIDTFCEDFIDTLQDSLLEGKKPLKSGIKHFYERLFEIYVNSILKRNISLNSKKLAIINSYNELNKECMEATALPLSIKFDIEVFSKRQCDFNKSSNSIYTKKL